MEAYIPLLGNLITLAGAILAVLIAVNRDYVGTPIELDPKKTKMLYAEMIGAMRKDSFEETNLSFEEVARNIPWTVGDEVRNPIDWTPRREIESEDVCPSPPYLVTRHR